MIFLFPTELEATPFIAARPQAKVVICGVGMAEAAATTARVAAEGEMVVLAGIAGAYDTQCNPIDQVVEVVSEQIEELPTQFAKRYETTPRWQLPRATSNSMNRSGAVQHTTQIENMEGAAVAAVCQRLNIEFHQIRAISNRVGDPISQWSIISAIEALAHELSKIYDQEL
ncbi:MAG: hypothetical protein SNH63_01365 [Rikenellaceae bacterium]